MITGKKLIPLLSVQLKIKQSFKLAPKSIIKKLNKYQQKNVNKWDLINVNKFIENINYNSKLLQDSVNLLNNIISTSRQPELLNWKIDIEQQLLSMIKAKKTLINLAQYASANILLSLNKKLVEESENMISLIRPSLAKQSLQPIFLKAQTVYQSYQTLNENLSLADSNYGNNKHSNWYKDWQKIEHTVLNIDDDLLKYPKTSLIRVQRLNLYINKYDKSSYLPKFKYQNETKLMSPHKKIQLLLNKLAIDRTIINYGLAANLMDQI